MLDSILYEEFDPLLSRTDYLFGIVRPLSGEVLLASREADTLRLLDANHKVSLSCLFNNDPLYLHFLLCNEKQLAYKNVGLWLFLSLLFLLTISGVIIHIMQRWKRQKQLSEIKTDFVNNMTHEFRTPISTISLASEMLLKKDVQENGERVSKYAHIIFNENARLQGQVERILQIAVIDKDDFKIRRKFFDANDVLRGLIRSFAMSIEKRGGVLRVCLEAKETILFADRVHFTNIIANLIDNANKYSPEKPDITLHTSNTDQGLLIMVKDQGIGIARENQEHVFRNLYRVPTGDLHDVKGFGLGLYYVKRMTDLHGGYVKVESEFGKGSKFYVFFPFGKESEEEE
jgi:two-component system phosphate regulon sensor histidine kinase PhoR